jgi:hypothetical protein
VNSGQTPIPPRLPRKRISTPPPPTVPIALFVCFAGAAAFFGLLAMVFPGAGLLGLTLVIFGLVFLAQYFVWGRWLYGYAVRKEREAEQRESPSDLPADESESTAGR